MSSASKVLTTCRTAKPAPFPEGTAGEAWWNEAGNMVYYGARNKRSLCMDVTNPRGKEVFLKLVEKADIVTDNFRPGTMQRFGFDHDSLSAINPRIITLSSTAYGYTGPWRRAGSRARTVDAACGLSYLTGYEGGPSMRASPNYMDHSVGNNVAYALLLALYQRNKTGKGMRVDLTMLETGVSSVGPAILEAQRGITRDRLGCAPLVEGAAQRVSGQRRRPLDSYCRVVRRGMGSAAGSNGPAPVGRGRQIRHRFGPLAPPP